MTTRTGGRPPTTTLQRWAGRLALLARAERGNAAIEFALATPILLGMLVPVADLGIAFSYRFGLIDSKHRDSLASYQMWEAGDERREDVGIALGCGDGAGGVSRRAGWGSSGASAGDLAAAVGGGGVGGGAGERV